MGLKLLQQLRYLRRKPFQLSYGRRNRAPVTRLQTRDALRRHEVQPVTAHGLRAAQGFCWRYRFVHGWCLDQFRLPGNPRGVGYKQMLVDI